MVRHARTFLLGLHAGERALRNALCGRDEQSHQASLEHKEGLLPGFTKKYGVKSLVWYEWHERIELAIEREKKIKRWRRDWKISLIEADNPRWTDLYPGLLRNGSRIGPVARPG
jgi:putative endonuclease